MLQESGYSQDTSTWEFLSGFNCRFLGGSGLTAEEANLLYYLARLWSLGLGF